MSSWAERQSALIELERRQLFFIGGAPRSGTTWLQQILDCHPEISCRGEGLFLHHMALPLEQAMAARDAVLAQKNATLFRHTGGYPPFASQDVEMLVGTAILLALSQQGADGRCRAIGEKTPENAFFFPRLKQLFPQARFLGIARDPRDVLTSAWHMFSPADRRSDVVALAGFISRSLPSLVLGLKAIAAFGAEHPDSYRMVTYERLREAPEPTVAALFRFLGVAAEPEIVRSCLNRTDFASQTGGRLPGDERPDQFHRKGVVGDWRSTLTPDLNRQVLHDLGHMFAWFGWEP